MLESVPLKNDIYFSSGVILNRAFFRQLLKADSLYRWHKPGEGLLLFGKNQEFNHEFAELALRPAIEEGAFSFLVLGEDISDGMNLESHDSFTNIVMDLKDLKDKSQKEIYDDIDHKLNAKPLSLTLKLPTYERTFYSPEERSIIRDVIQQVLLWMDSHINLSALDREYSGVVFLDHLEKYISKEQTGLISQINIMKLKNYCTGFHFHTVPRNVDANTGIMMLFEEQSFILMLDKALKRNLSLFNLFRNNTAETKYVWTRIVNIFLPCPRTLISKRVI